MTSCNKIHILQNVTLQVHRAKYGSQPNLNRRTISHTTLVAHTNGIVGKIVKYCCTIYRLTISERVFFQVGEATVSDVSSEQY